MFAGTFWLSLPGRASAQWATFVNETSTRLVAAPNVGSANPDEKDYAWGDVDQDGDTDLVAVYKKIGTSACDNGPTHNACRRNVLFMNEGGVLVDRTVEYASAATVTLQGGAPSQGFLDLTNDRDVALADFNGDGWLDIVTATTLSEPLGKAISHPRIYINLGDDPPGSGNWQGFIYDDVNRVPTMPDEPRFCSVSTGDIDQDGDVDVYFGDYQQSANNPGGWPGRSIDVNDRLWINDGTGYFTDQSTMRMTFQMLESSFAMSTAIADMNGDGRLDIVKDDALNAPQGVSISYNNRAGTPGMTGFFDAYEIPYAFTPYHIAVGDLNNDSRLDLVVTDDSVDRYILNQGNGADNLANFGPAMTLIGSFQEFGGNNWIADLDNDGWNDVLVSNVDVDLWSCATASKIYHNLGNAPNVTLTEQGTLGIPSNVMNGIHDWGVFDLNDDGWLDLVIGMCEGTTVYMNQPPLGVDFNYPEGLPDGLQEPDAPITINAELVPTGIATQIEPGTAQIHVSIDDGPFTSFPLTHISGNDYEITLPGLACMSTMNYYFSAQVDGSVATFLDPSTAPTNTYFTFAAVTTETTSDHIEGDVSGWQIADDPGLAAGTWEQAVPVGTTISGALAAPSEDAEAGPAFIRAFVTQNCPPAPTTCGGHAAGSADVDGGATHLISPIIDLVGNELAEISYMRWFFSSTAGNTLSTFVTNNGNSATPTWVLVHSTTGTLGHISTEWQQASFRVSDYVTPTDQVRVRFTAVDNAAAVVEAGIDLFSVSRPVCEVAGCSDAASCCDTNTDNIRDDSCIWCACDDVCNELQLSVFADMGGSFGACEPDGFANLFDRSHALTCFENNNPCETINIDAGGAFGSCQPDGFCNLFDANHAVTAFSGVNPCTCPGGPAPSFEPVIAGQAAIKLVPDRRAASPGDTVTVKAYLTDALDNLQSYQLHLGVEGGRSGSLELVDVAIEDESGFVFDGSETFEAANIARGQMLAGLNSDGGATAENAYLATFTYRVPKNASGTFVVDVLHNEGSGDQTFLVAGFNNKVEVTSVEPAVITVRQAGVR